MHILSTSQYTEFSGSPSLVQATLAFTGTRFEPTLLLKADSLPLKYVVLSSGLTIRFLKDARGALLYGVDISDDPHDPGIVWSLASSQDEIDALVAAVSSGCMAIALFNELSVNVASVTVSFTSISHNSWKTLHETFELVPPLSHAHYKERSANFPPMTDFCVVEGLLESPWTPIESYYFSGHAATPGRISLFDDDEGSQQEHLATWLSGSLDAVEIVRRPCLSASNRELTDLLLTYEHGCFLLESKALSILSRATLPSREDLRDDIEKHIDKAVKQLGGSIRSLRRGLAVVDSSGRSITIHGADCPHLIVLVPDLSLLSSSTAYSGRFFRESTERMNAFFHILDITELVRTVQGGVMLSRSSQEPVTAIEAFDYLLMQRAKRSISAESPDFEIIYR